MTGIPMKPGYYWAKLRVPAEGTHEAELWGFNDTWEIVQVNENCADWDENPADDEALSVAVPGIRETQWRECFVWGEFVAPLDKPSHTATGRHRRKSPEKPARPPSDRNIPLQASIDDGVLTFRIGVDCLAVAVKLSPALATFDSKTDQWVEPVIPSADEFAKDVMRYATIEIGEDGTTFIHQALDKAANEAVEQGAYSILVGDEAIENAVTAGEGAKS